MIGARALLRDGRTFTRIVAERIGLPPGRDRLPASQCSWRDVLSAR